MELRLIYNPKLIHESKVVFQGFQFQVGKLDTLYAADRDHIEFTVKVDRPSLLELVKLLREGSDNEISGQMLKYDTA